MSINFISRKEAENKINQYRKKAIEVCEELKLNPPIYSIERTRNYEIEDDLVKTFGGEWVINEWCPDNWIWCAWGRHCPIEELEKLLNEWKLEADIERTRHYIKVIEQYIDNRRLEETAK